MALKNIFEQLELLEVPYAVVQSASNLRGTSSQICSDFFLITSTKFYNKIKRFKFVESSYKKTILERDISEEEKEIFKKFMRENHFKMVLTSNDGKIYETKNSFLLSYKSTT